MDKILALVSKRQNPQPSSPFLDLPGELRNNIYAQLFVNITNEVAIPLTKKRRTTSEKLKHKLTPRGKPTPKLSLLLTCKQIYHETFKYVHGSCHAEIYTPATFMAFENFRVMAKQFWTNASAKQINTSLAVSGAHMKYITQLDLKGTAAVSSLFVENNLAIENQIGLVRSQLQNRSLSTRRAASKTEAFIRAFKHLQNVEVISIDVLEGCIRRQCRKLFQKEVCSASIMETFPKLKTVQLETDEGPEIIWQRPDEYPKVPKDDWISPRKVSAYIDGI
ncbi:hypothetical protein LTR37_021282 [Vermiconidia calcicola]|uniref:Uncharacterized protein n=1 Tax=Vermiconidia calcicola TaxID=1690605 RepID=A0ACC3M8Y6_9PEZI|nr:hypothetical protein LTR37_021282 [Vermiconidia calcicola]